MARTNEVSTVSEKQLVLEAHTDHLTLIVTPFISGVTVISVLLGWEGATGSWTKDCSRLRLVVG